MNAPPGKLVPFRHDSMIPIGPRERIRNRQLIALTLIDYTTRHWPNGPSID
jgi:hypothetical protein